MTEEKDERPIKYKQYRAEWTLVEVTIAENEEDASKTEEIGRTFGSTIVYTRSGTSDALQGISDALSKDIESQLLCDFT